ncbi:UNVERIFIED_CONTAM: hypothetical protein PYX00_008453 [Menopon gallinae]|uniref:Uncharacterized protein n=1 Tax=Menopon gallinae TaxID=328185 RepID=A0AAW2HPD5_9NEOP
MCDSAPAEDQSKPAEPKRILRNGLDYVPPKTYPPDYSNVPSVREWQMSPFPQERFDLDEQQRWEKMGEKGKRLLAALKGPEQEVAAEEKEKAVDTCAKCQERERCNANQPEMQRYLYQPYGPSPLPLRPPPAIRRPPQGCGGLTGNVPECDSWVVGHDYIPYGPTAGVKPSPDCYKPYGPMCDKGRKEEKNYQKLVDPPAEQYGSILGDPKPEEDKSSEKKAECVQIVVCSPPMTPCVNDKDCEKKSS